VASAADNYANAKTEFQYFTYAIDLRVGSWRTAFDQISAAFIDAHDDLSETMARHEKRQLLINQLLGSVATTVLTGGAVWLLEVGALGSILGVFLANSFAAGIGEAFSAVAPTWAGLLAAPSFTTKDSFVMSLRLRQNDLEQRKTAILQGLLAQQFMGENQAGSPRWNDYQPGRIVAGCQRWLQASQQFRGAGGLPSVEEMAKEFARGLWAHLGSHRWALGVLPKLLDRIPGRLLTKMKEADIPIESFHQYFEGGYIGGDMMMPPQEWWSMSAFANWARAYQPVDFVRLAEQKGRVERIEMPPAPVVGEKSPNPGRSPSHLHELSRILTFIGNRPAGIDPFLNQVRTRVVGDLYGPDGFSGK
jgi:hypothetical protein